MHGLLGIKKDLRGRDRQYLKSICPHIMGSSKTLRAGCCAVLVGPESIFFTVAGVELCVGFVLNTGMIKEMVLLLLSRAYTQQPDPAVAYNGNFKL